MIEQEELPCAIPHSFVSDAPAIPLTHRPMPWPLLGRLAQGLVDVGLDILHVF